MRRHTCLNCGTPLTRKGQVKFCGIPCSNIWKLHKPVARPDTFVEDLRLQSMCEPPPVSVCRSFACGKHLTRQEAMAGDKCLDHMRHKPFDVTSIIQSKQ